MRRKIKKLNRRVFKSGLRRYLKPEIAKYLKYEDCFEEYVNDYEIKAMANNGWGTYELSQFETRNFATINIRTN